MSDARKYKVKSFDQSFEVNKMNRKLILSILPDPELAFAVLPPLDDGQRKRINSGMH